MQKKTTKATEVKAAEVKTEVKVEAPKAETKEVKAAAKKAPAKKATTKKAESTKKAPAKKAAATTEIVLQFQGNEVVVANVEEKVKAAYVAEGHKESAIKSVKLYVKPEDSAVYYVINEKAVGVVSLF